MRIDRKSISNLKERSLFCTIGIILLLFFLPDYTTGSTRTAVISSPDSIYQSLNDYLEIYKDTANLLTFDQLLAQDDIPFKPYRHYELPLDKRSTYWGKIKIENASSKHGQWILRVCSTISLFEVYIIENDTLVETKKGGYLRPLSQTDFQQGHEYETDISIPANTTYTLFLRNRDLTGNPVSFTVALTPQLQWFKQHKLVDFINALFLGMAWILMGYHLILFLATREKAYLFYTLYCLSVVLFFQMLADFKITGLVAEHPVIRNYVLILTAGSTFIFYLKFLKQFLNIKRISPFLAKSIDWIIGIKIFIIIIEIITLGITMDLFLINNTIGYVLIIENIITLGIIVVLFRSGDYLSRYIVIGSSILIVSLLLTAFNFIFYWSEWYHIFQAGFVLELLMFAVGLGVRLSTTEKEKIRVLEDNRKLMLNQNELLEKSVEARAREIHDKTTEIRNINASLEHIVKESTESLQKTNKKLTDINKEMDMFFYRSSHDLKRPLTTLLGLSELAKMEFDDEKATALLNEADHTIYHMDRMIKKLSYVHDINITPLKSERIAFDDLVEELNTQFKSELVRQNIELISENTDFKVVRHYKDYLMMILQLLVENSIAFHRENESQWIKISFEKHQGGFDVTVEDNGHGIEPDIIPYIFSMYYRGSEKSQGNGLGLYVVKKAVEKLRGSINVKSQHRQWTSFQIHIPYVEQSEELFS